MAHALHNLHTHPTIYDRASYILRGYASLDRSVIKILLEQFRADINEYSPLGNALSEAVTRPGALGYGSGAKLVYGHFYGIIPALRRLGDGEMPEEPLRRACFHYVWWWRGIVKQHRPIA